jgi:SAM-dependent methyltransferase
MRAEKQVVREFYDTFGWEKDSEGAYKDTVAFVDRRPVLDAYSRKTHRRVLQFLAPRGEYFLDAGCGAIPHAEYLEYARNYRWRICVDLSTKALTEARAKVGAKGLLVAADVTRLPFGDDTFDGVISAHVLYHVPYDEQEAAVRELYRVLAPGGTCVIVYTWPGYWYSRLHGWSTAVLCRIARIPGVRPAAGVARALVGAGTRPAGDTGRCIPPQRPPLYFRPHDHRWFRRTFAGTIRMEIRSWRSVDRLFTQRLVPEGVFGRLMMKGVYWAEELFPHLLGRMGRYPLIILRK